MLPSYMQQKPALVQQMLFILQCAKRFTHPEEKQIDALSMFNGPDRNSSVR